MVVSRSNVPGNLPAEVTSLVGRASETVQIRSMLSESRLITLIGMGGVGKTRLALRLAREVSRAFPDGVWLAELASVRDPDLVPTALAGMLGLERGAAAAILPGLADYLASRELLIVMDNCEHLIGSCAIVSAELLRLCPGVRLVATSREPLGIEGERIFAVPALGVPEPGVALTIADFGDYPAIRLFVDRVMAANPQFEVTEERVRPIIEICRSLDGIPLALELAASKLRTLAPAQLMVRLNDRFSLLGGGNRAASPRQQTLRALVDWSYELCSSMEQVLWNRLSAFQGPFDLAAAEAVCSGEEISEDKVVHVLAGLVDKSVLTTTHAPDVVEYRLSETLREYAAEKLSEPERAELRRRHVQWYTEVVRLGESLWFTPHQISHLASLRREHANLRAALSYCLEQSDQVSAGLKMAAALRFYWSISGHLAEGAHWLDRLLAVYPKRDQLRVEAIRVRAILAALMDDSTRADQALADASELARNVNDPAELGFVLQVRGVVALFRGDAALASECLENADRLHRSVGDRSGATYDEIMWALAAVHAGQVDQAATLLEGALAIARANGANWTVSLGLFVGGIVALQQGDTSRARRLQQESIELRLPLDDTRNIGLNFEVLAWCASADGGADRAAVLFGAARRIEEDVATPLRVWQPLFALHSEYELATRASLGEASYARTERDGRNMDFRDAVSFALGRSANRAPLAGPGTGPLGALTRREREIARLVGEGLSNKEIAAELVLSTRTVEAHVNHLLSKLNFKSRTQVATWVSRYQTSGDKDTDSGAGAPRS